ncbi:MAG: rhodanese-like domain-containing protein [Bacteroidetes bacterium]|nr:rhodanese-like domain-containing protein [Bacteroidota bacterium]
MSQPVQESAEPWRVDQLLDPAELAKTLLEKSAKQPYIFSIGPSGDILSSTDIGPLNDSINYSKFRTTLEPLDRNAEIVIYCGCCPFENCPNIRPGFELLNNLNFTNHKLLNLPQNLKADWIDKGYPMKE